jgi:hypothetical protein|nr:MAG TPA_asm: hypothetical protein [Caudoviricetes sp.]
MSERIPYWSVPKTDWTKDDKFNISDYNRIKNNLEYVRAIAITLYLSFDLEDMGEDKELFTDYFYASEFNTIEQNLELLNQKVFTQDIGKTTTFYDNGVFIQYDELNRIESAILKIWDMLLRQSTSRERLSFRLGNMKGIKI